MHIPRRYAWECQCFYASHPEDKNGWRDPAICEQPKKNGSDYICADDLEDAQFECANTCGSVPYAIGDRINPEAPIACLVNPVSMSCTGWDPASEITYHSGGDYYGMDWTFIAGLVSDPEPIWACDDTYFDLVSGYFVVTDADSGELLYELGLRDDDKIVSLNDIAIADYNDVALVFGELWGETSFTLKIIRGTNNIEIDYVLFVSF